MAKIWMIRAGHQSTYARDFISKGIVAIGWAEIGPIEKGTSKSDIAKLYRTAYTLHSDRQVLSSVNQIAKFLDEMAIGDIVITYDSKQRLYYTGTIDSDPNWKPEINLSLPRIRHVKWLNLVSRDAIISKNIGALGSLQTLWELKEPIAQHVLSRAVAIK